MDKVIKHKRSVEDAKQLINSVLVAPALKAKAQSTGKLEVDNLTIKPYYNNELELHIDEVAYAYLSAKEALLLRDYLSKWIDDLTCPSCESEVDPEQIGEDGCCMCTADDGWGEE